MGWLFGKRKVVPQVPFPERKGTEESTLRFPPAPGDRVFEPEQVKAAVGIGKRFSWGGDTSSERSSESMMGRTNTDLSADSVEASNSAVSGPSAFPSSKSEPLYIKVEVYRHLLGEMESLRRDLSYLHTVTSHLQASEYNEEHHFTKLRRAMRGMHDRLLQVDKLMFKG